MSKKLLFNFNREVIQNYTYVKYVGTIITATNTLEKPIKSAILKGQTLVNLAPNSKVIFQKAWALAGSVCSLRSQNNRCCMEVDVKPNTIYTIYSNSETYIRESKEDYTVTKSTDVFTNGVRLITTLSETTKLLISFRKDSADTIYTEIEESYGNVVIEGDYTNVDIPYFEGMQSVRMPVLTTSNEDGTKTNILTVNEDIELRAIGDIRDELDCLTGEYVQRLGERTFVGNDDENWTLRNTFTNTILFANDNLGLNGFTDYALSNTKMICDKFICGAYENQDIEFVCMRFTGQGVMIGISSSKLATQNVVGFKQWLTQNPITIQYHLAAESVKTVDLSILDQNENKVSSISSFNDTTHIAASSETIPPIFEGYLATKEG